MHYQCVTSIFCRRFKPDPKLSESEPVSSQIHAPNPSHLPDAAGTTALLDQLSDADLLDAWRTDQQTEALAALVNRYSVMVLSVCRRRCRSAADAEDAFQSTFLYLAGSAKKIKDPTRLPGWLHRVAQRAAIATTRSRDYESESMSEVPDTLDGPLTKLTRRHDAIVLDEELSNLPDHYRAAMVMHLLEGKSYESLATQFGSTIGAIRGHVQRGKKLLAGRLRRRGVVPVLAFAAANAMTVSANAAADASSFLPPDLPPGDLPPSPIDASILQTLLAQGISLMPSLVVTAGTVGAGALIALMMLVQSPANGQSDQPDLIVQLPSGGSADQTDAVGQFQAIPGDMPNPKPPAKTTAQQKKQAAAAVPTPAPSAIANALTEALDSPTVVAVNTTIGGLADALSKATDLPVILDRRTLEMLQVDTLTKVNMNSRDQPLRSSLREYLQPLGLKAIVQDDALVVTADMTYWTRKGLQTDRWIDQGTDQNDRFDEALDKPVSQSFNDTPLEEAVAQLSEQLDIPMIIDRTALEEVGLTVDTPVNITLKSVRLKSFLNLMLRDLELTYHVSDEVLQITTREAAETNLRGRIYFLEATGIAQGNIDHLIETIQSTVNPDTWDALGGPSTISVLHIGVGNRPSIIVSSMMDVHAQIESTMQTLRDTHFGPDPGTEAVVPVQTHNGGMGGGGMGGGMF